MGVQLFNISYGKMLNKHNSFVSEMNFIFMINLEKNFLRGGGGILEKGWGPFRFVKCHYLQIDINFQIQLHIGQVNPIFDLPEINYWLPKNQNICYSKFSHFFNLLKPNKFNF